MLLDPQTLALTPRAPEVLARLPGDSRVKLELPATQLELVTPPRATVGQAVADLAVARDDLVGSAGDLVRPAAAGFPPSASPVAELNRGDRYEAIAREYGWVARQQLVCSLQVHVAVGGAERTLAVYNALRGYLPELAALAANAPLRDGDDTGLASVRPLVCAQLPRQGVPPAIASWEKFAEDLSWGAAAGATADPMRWWWELRPHVRHGTLELRVPDTQTTIGEAAGVATFAQALVATLSDRFDAGESLGSPPSWRIEENRWSALRYGLEGQMASLETGAREPTRDRLRELLTAVRPAAVRLGSEELLGQTEALIAVNGAMRQREVFGSSGADGVAAWLADRFTRDLEVWSVA